MQLKTHILRAILTLFVMLGMLGLVGCDAFTGTEAGEVATGETAALHSTAKFRHAHLLDRALRTDGAIAGKSTTPGNGLNNGNGKKVGLIMKLDPQRALDRYRVLDRFKAIDRFKAVERFEYENVFEGFAIIVEDTTGVGDFEDFFQALIDDPDVEWFEPDILIELDPSSLPPVAGSGSQVTPWGIDRIGGIGQEAKDVKVFVMDTGVSHDDVKVEDQIDFTGSASGADDIDGHGTHVAGTIAAEDDGDGIVGVAPKSKIYSLKVVPDVDPDPNSGEVDLSTAIAAVEYVTTEKLSDPSKPVVVNISLGADIGTPLYNALDEAIVASSAVGVVYVVAAGNGATDAATYSPAHVAEAITVGAYDADDRFAAFSNYGAVVDILAPGTDILSLEKGNGGSAVNMSGTSMAAPHVAGAVALFLKQNPQASPALVAQALKASGKARILGAPQGTTDKTVDVSDLMEVQTTPFYAYALAADDDLIFEVPVTVSYDGLEPVNASLFSNHHIEFKTSGANHVEGFGYANGDVKPSGEAAVTFQPRFNPTGLQSYREDVTKIEIPDFRPEDYQHLATQTSGSVMLSGIYTLGTAAAPMVWYIDGDLKTSGDVTFTGYGILLIKDKVEIKHNVTATGPDTNVGFYTGKDFIVKKDSGPVDLTGHVLSRQKVEVEGVFRLTGSMISGTGAKFKRGNGGAGSVEILYRPPSEALTSVIWPMTVQKIHEGQPSSARRLLSRF